VGEGAEVEHTVGKLIGGGAGGRENNESEKEGAVISTVQRGARDRTVMSGEGGLGDGYVHCDFSSPREPLTPRL